MAISDVISAIKYTINSTVGTSGFKSIDVMLSDLKTAINTSVSSQISALNTKITSVETTANNANTAAAANTANKMDKTNPTGTGTFSVSRTINTTVGDSSFAFQGAASGNIAVSLSGNAAGSASFAVFGDAYNGSCIAIGPDSSAGNSSESGIVGKYSLAIGKNTTASGTGSIAIGTNAISYASEGISIGSRTKTDNTFNIAIGNDVHTIGSRSIAIGAGLTAHYAYETVMGATMGYDHDGDRLIIANGTTGAGSNCFRVTDSAVYAKGNYNASGADYAEMFEWVDGNPNNEDRTGLFVKLDGEGISISESEDDFILGVVSAAPSICGDTASEDWQGRFKHDIFGRILFEEIEVPEETQEVTDPETGETKTEIVSPTHTRTWYKQNPNWNPDEKYIPREDRPEWDPVGLIGKLVMIDDGTAEVNGYVKPSKGGIATKSEKHTRFRVMKRIDDTHIRILMLTYEPRV